MSVQSRALIKSWFETGDFPTAEQFADWIDSFFHKNEDQVTASPEQIRNALASLTGNNRLQAIAILTDAFNRFVTDAQVTLWDSKVNPSQLTDVISALKDNVPAAGDTLRKLYEAVQTLQNLVTSNDVNLDTVQEIVTFIKNNKDVIDSISTNKVDIADIVDNLLSIDPARPLSAKQGNALKSLIDALTAIVDGKVDKNGTDALMTLEERTKLSGIQAGANNYIHPETHPATIVDQDSTHRFVTDDDKTSWNNRATPAQITDAVTGLKDNVPVAGDSLRKLYEAIQTLQSLVVSDDVNLDTIQEIVAFIKSNQNLIDQISTNKVNKSDIVDDLTSNDTQKPLSANQGRVLKTLIDALVLVVDNKVDKVAGKGLSTNDYTTDEKNKVAGIEAGAQVNTVASVNGKAGIVVINKADVNLSNVDNTSDMQKAVSFPQQEAINAALQGQATFSAIYAYQNFI